MLFQNVPSSVENLHVSNVSLPHTNVRIVTVGCTVGSWSLKVSEAVVRVRGGERDVGVIRKGVSGRECGTGAAARDHGRADPLTRGGQGPAGSERGGDPCSEAQKTDADRPRGC